MHKLIPLVVVGLVASCGYYLWDTSDDCRSYSRFRCSQLEGQTYNVHFWFPDNDKDYYLGQAKGLSGCQFVARSYARQKQVQTSDWSYICCLQTSESSCAEKHR